MNAIGISICQRMYIYTMKNNYHTLKKLHRNVETNLFINEYTWRMVFNRIFYFEKIVDLN